MADKEKIIDGVDVSDWADEEVRYKFEKHSSKAIRQIAFDLYKQLKQKEQELQAQRNFTTQEQRKIYCVAYDKTCETDNECKQKKCVFKDRLKYKQALDEIERFCKDACDSCKKFTPNRQSDISCRFCQATQILNIINKVKEK